MNSNEIKNVEPPNDVDAHVMIPDSHRKEAVPNEARRLVIGDSREDDVEAHVVLPADLAGMQPPRDLDIER